MTQRSTTASALLARVGRMACVLALGALLAGCDRCGDWFGWNSGNAQVCRQQAPKPQ
jgi:hypothetical protein